MASRVRYQWKFSRESGEILFEGSSLPLDALKREISAREHLEASGMDLVLVSERKTAHMHAWGGDTLRCMSLSTRTCVHHSCHAFDQGWRSGRLRQS